MNAVTVTQPWATLIAIRAKRYETRSWSTRYRGPLAIHAAREASLPVDDLVVVNRPAFVDKLTAAGFTRSPVPGPWVGLPYSAIVAVVRLADCLRVEELESQPITVYEYAFGNYAPGRYAWRLEDVVALPTPVTCRGFQGLWTPEPAIVAQVEAQLQKARR